MNPLSTPKVVIEAPYRHSRRGAQGRCALVVLALLALVGCEPELHRTDQCLRHALFVDCLERLKSIPGPTTTHYSDWDEVVDACERAATYQSSRTLDQIKPECRP